MRRGGGWWIGLLICLIVTACGEAKRPTARPTRPRPPLEHKEERAQGFYHVVSRGENLWRICKAYGADLQQVAEYNNIQDVAQIKVGQKIFIPGAKGARKVDVPTSPLGPAEPTPRIEVYRGKLIWPLRGQLSSQFGVRDGFKHAGVDIVAPLGTPILAAAAGEVAYRGQLRGYGNIIILKHSEEFTTVYAHLKDWLVQEHQSVRQGEAIATVGNTGQSEGAHLHFEVRVRNQPRNPLFYLPE
jgi:murein DD-endopeptidase MepM/ murein hydrolase activator NlpD